MATLKKKINELTQKENPVLGDSIVISDSENSGRGALVEITDIQTLIGGGGGGGAVDSVAGKTGVVTLDASDIAETAALKIMTADERTKLTGIAENANNYTHPATHPQSMIEGLSDALAAKAPLASPALTGTPTAPTAAVGTNTTQLATTEFVQDALAEISMDADPYSVKLTGDQSIAGIKTFTSSPVLPTPTAGDNTTKGSTTAFVTGAVAACRPKHPYVAITTASTAIAAERGNTYGVNANGCTLTLPAATGAGHVDGDEICVVVGVSAARELTIVSPGIILRGTGMQPVNTPFNVTGCGTFISFVKSSNVWAMTYPEYELSLKAPLASPALTGTPTAPTAAAGTNTTQLATTAFCAAGINAAIAPLAPLASPALTGTPTAPTAAAGTNTTQLATTAFCAAALAGKVTKWAYQFHSGGVITGEQWNIHSFSSSGTLNLPLASTVPDGTQIAAMVVSGAATSVTIIRNAGDQFITPTGLAESYTLAGRGSSIVLVKVTANAWAALGAPDSLINAAIAPLAPLASPALTGTPTAPTAAVGTNSTRIATTAFVQAALAGALLKNGTPSAQTAAAGSNTTQLATTEFVQDAKAEGALLTEGTPSGPTATGTKGMVRFDANYFYVCTATNTWVRFAKDGSWT